MSTGHSANPGHYHKVTAAALLVSLGIIYGDIGTSPLYVLKAIVGSAPINKGVVLGGISCIFWTLTLQTTFKYVILTLQADNKGEGGIFALYSLVRRKISKKWLLFAAIVGGSSLLADGMITPPISISSAVEGLKLLKEDISTIPIVVVIVTLIFTIQQFGTRAVGRFFGPVMFVWFTMLAVLGAGQIMGYPEVLKAFNPVYGYRLLTQYPSGFLLLGAVFLCTTGAEALYSDLGHCGKENIRITWGFVKICLLINYFGQGAWLISNEGKLMADFAGGNPFYSIMPSWFLIPGILVATLAAIVASQAMISGSFTLVSEAVRLDLWPKVKIDYPSDLKGQLYIPSINWILYVGCIAVVLYFKESSNMEAAYGLAIILTMQMTTILLCFYMISRHFNKLLIAFIVILYAAIEMSFLIANLHKFPHGGWVTLLIASMLFSVMWVLHKAKNIKAIYAEFIKIADYLPFLKNLSEDQNVPKYATHLVYLSNARRGDQIESKVLYSILEKKPKRADVYWLVHVDFVDEPYRTEYSVTTLIPNHVIRIDFMLGFRVEPRLNLMFRKVADDLLRSKEVAVTHQYESLFTEEDIGDFRFVVIQKFLSFENELPAIQKVILKTYFILKSLGISESTAFGLDASSVTIEKTPLVIVPAQVINLQRIDPEH